MAARILIADDNPVLCELLCETLEEEGYSVEIAHDGFSVITKAQTYVPDLFLIDLLMPGMDGYETIRQIRNDTRMAHLPIIVLTASTDMKAVVTGFESGADDYITKPFHTPELLVRIKSQVERANRRPVQNPLTGLPGNVLIEQEINHFLRNQQPFALLYVDLNNFKAFNDTFGFARGDQLIQLLADILMELKNTCQPCFVGHIGGDDFTVLLATDHVASFCESVIELFEQKVPMIAVDDEHPLLRDHHGRPLTVLPEQSLSIGVVQVYHPEGETYASLGRRAAQIKAQVKQKGGNAYAIDEGPTALQNHDPVQPKVIVLDLPAMLFERVQHLVTRQRWAIIGTPDTPQPSLIITLADNPTLATLQHHNPEMASIVLAWDGERVSHLTVDVPIPSDTHFEQYLAFALHLKRLEAR